MKKLILIAALAVALGGCAKQIEEAKTAWNMLTGDIVTPQQAIIAVNGFDAVKVTATKYLRLPRCPQAALCRSPAATPTVISLIRAGTADRDQIKAALRASPDQNLSLIDVYRDISHTTDALVAIVGH